METPSDSTYQYTIEELERATGFSVRTIRFYIGRELLPGPGGRGKQAVYGEDHLLRLRLIRLLTDQHVPLDGIRDRLATLGTGDVRALLEVEQPQAESLKQVAESPKDYIALLLERARQRDDGGFSAAPAPAPSARPPQSVTQTNVFEHRRDILSAPAVIPAVPGRAPAEARVRKRSLLDPWELMRQPPAQAPELASEQWSRYELAPGLELHERAGVAPDVTLLRQRLLALFRQLRQQPDATATQEP